MCTRGEDFARRKKGANALGRERLLGATEEHSIEQGGWMEQKQQLVAGRQEGRERLAEESMGLETLVRTQISKAPLPRLDMMAPIL